MADPRITQIIEAIAQQWDGCEYDSPGGLIDIGDAIRRAGLPMAVAASQEQQPAQQTDLHAAILGLRGTPPRLPHPSDYGSYELGHREARHAAAELVAAAPQQPAQQAAPLTKERVFQIADGLPHQPWGVGSRHSDAYAFARAIESAHGIALPPAAKEQKR